MVLENPVQAIGGAAVLFCLLLGALYLLDPQITSKVWLGLIFVMIGLVILLILLGAWGVGALVIGAIAAFVGRVILDRMGVGE